MMSCEFPLASQPRSLPLELMALVENADSHFDRSAQDCIEGRKRIEPPELIFDVNDARRDLFGVLVTVYGFDERLDWGTVETLWRLCGLLWDDRTPLPSNIAGDVSEIVGRRVCDLRRYAQAARSIRRHMRSHKPRVRVKALAT